jgi:hypothetical protein
MFLIFNTFSLMQLEDSTLSLILDILCKIYRGEVCVLLLSYSQLCFFGSYLLLTIHCFKRLLPINSAGVTLYSVLGQGKFYRWSYSVSSLQLGRCISLQDCRICSSSISPLWRKLASRMCVSWNSFSFSWRSFYFSKMSSICPAWEPFFLMVMWDGEQSDGQIYASTISC